jgi:opacity protein-like surface antigen
MRSLIIAATLLVSVSAQAQYMQRNQPTQPTPGQGWYGTQQMQNVDPNWQRQQQQNQQQWEQRQQMQRYCRETYMQRGGSHGGSFRACPN